MMTPARIEGFTVTALPEGGGEADMLSASGEPEVSGEDYSYKLYFSDPPQRDTGFTISVTPVAKAGRAGFDLPETKTSSYTYRAIQSLTIKAGGEAVGDKTVYLQTGGERQTVQLTADKNPTSQSYAAEVLWSSSDPAIASVDPVTGMVTGNGGGTVTITASVYDDPDTVSASCTVTVIPISGIGLNPASKTLFTGGTAAETDFDLTATLSGDNGGTELVWENSNPDQVDMTKVSGNVYHLSANGKQPGSATITVMDKGGFYKAACTVTVVQVQSVSVLPSTLTLYTSGSPRSGTLSATVSPSAYAPAWAAEDESLVSVAGSGKSCTVTANTSKGGSTTVTASVGGRSGSCTVTVQHITGIRFTELPGTLYLGGSSVTGQAQAALEGGGTGPITYRSSDPSVASVNASTGVVTAVGKGSYTLTATAPNGISVTSEEQEVVQRVTGITIATDSLEKGTNLALSVSVTPQNANEKGLSWSLESGSGIASINSTTGTVTAVGQSGTITVKAAAKDGSGVTASKTVTIEGCEHALAAGGYGGGAGTAAKPWKVSSVEQLKHVGSHLGANFSQTKNLALSGTWTTLGTLTGTYNGNGLEITGMDCNLGGLFYAVTGNASEVRRVILVSPKARQGAISCIVNEGAAISDCVVTDGLIRYDPGICGPNDYVTSGGIAGIVENATFQRCTFSGTVGGDSNFDLYRGGIVGHSLNTTFIGCISSAQFTGSAPNMILTGGISGAIDRHIGPVTLQNCHWSNPVYAIGRTAAYGGDFTPNEGSSYGNSQIT